MGKSNTINVIIKGRVKTFPSFSEACRQLGKSLSKCRQRVNRLGWTIEQALEIEPPPSVEKYTVKGKCFPSFSAVCREFGVVERTARTRFFNSGWTIEQSLGIDPPPPKKPNRPICQHCGDRHVFHKTVVKVKGRDKIFCSRTAACRAFGMKVKNVEARLKYGWTLEQALGIEERPTVIKYKVNSKSYASLESLARDFNLLPRTVYGRLKAGWTIQQAVDIEPPPDTKTRKRIKVKGEWFHSVSDAARKYGLKPSTVLSRIRKGWSVEQALELDKAPSNRKAKCEYCGRNPHVFNETVVKVNGEAKVFCSFRAACREFGVGFTTARERKNSLGWSLEQALGIEAPPKHAKHVYGLVYAVTHTESGMQYIGQTKQRLNRRWRNHCETAEKEPTSCKYAAKEQKRPLIAAIREHGRNAFTVEVIDEADSIHELNEKERYWIDELKTRSPDGYNDTGGGGGCVNVRGKKVTVQGKEFDSIADAAEHYGCNLETVYSRVNREGWTLEQVFDLKPRYQNRNTTGFPIDFEYDGVSYSYSSLAEAARSHGVLASTAESRKRLDWPIEEILGLAPHENQAGRNLVEALSIPVTFTMKGRRYSFESMSECCRHFQVPKTMVDQRIKNLGWSIQKALTEPKRAPADKPRTFTVDGKKYTFSNLKLVAEHFKVSYDALQHRVNNCGWTGARAVTTPVKQKPKDLRFTHTGKKYVFPSLHSAFENFGTQRECGISFATVKTRVYKQGWKVGRALTTPSLRPRKSAV